MRVLFVLHSPRDPYSAVFGYTQARADLLAAHGHRVEILVPQDLSSLTGFAPRYWPLVYPIAVALRLWQGRAFDVILFHSYTGWAFNLTKALLRHRPRTITQFHGLEPLYHEEMRREMERSGRPFGLGHRALYGWLMPRLLRATCRRSDRVFCLNREEQAYLVATRWSAASKTLLVPNAVRRRFFREPRTARPIKRFLFVAQWIEGKGIRYLAPAFDSLLSELPDAELHCVGVRRGAAEVRAAFLPPSRERVFIVEETDGAGIAAALEAADAFVFPSLSEGSSLALLEAMASGLPIVTTSVGASPDMLVDGASALFVPKADPSKLRDAMLRLAADPALAARLGRAAREAALAFVWEERCLDYLRLVEETAS